MDLSEASGELAAEWFNPETGKNVLGEMVRGSMADVFRSQNQWHAMLYLTKREI